MVYRVTKNYTDITSSLSLSESNTLEEFKSKIDQDVPINIVISQMEASNLEDWNIWKDIISEDLSLPNSAESWDASTQSYSFSRDWRDIETYEKYTTYKTSTVWTAFDYLNPKSVNAIQASSTITETI